VAPRADRPAGPSRLDYDDTLGSAAPASISAAPPGRSIVRAVEEVSRPRSGARRRSAVLQTLGKARSVLGRGARELAGPTASRLDLRPWTIRVGALQLRRQRPRAVLSARSSSAGDIGVSRHSAQVRGFKLLPGRRLVRDVRRVSPRSVSVLLERDHLRLPAVESGRDLTRDPGGAGLARVVGEMRVPGGALRQGARASAELLRYGRLAAWHRCGRDRLGTSSRRRSSRHLDTAPGEPSARSVHRFQAWSSLETVPATSAWIQTSCRQLYLCLHPSLFVVLGQARSSCTRR
jgi:hypothetical protein